ncbi:aspartate--tRNA ligase, partial [Chitinophagales bacterium]|nr:aspartate--tRNA ligase [Chitinophagales bacterium]
TQIDCELTFVDQEDVLNTFEGMMRHILRYVHEVEVEDFPRMTWHEAMRLYGNDKPDIRFGMQFVELNDVAQNKGFAIFDSAELVVGICVPGAASYTRKKLDALTDFVKRPQVGAKGMVYVKCNEDGTFKSSVDKFFDQEKLKAWADKMDAKPGDLLLVISGEADKARTQLSALRLHVGDLEGLRKPDDFKFLWVVDFPLLEWAEEEERWVARHHPFTSPKAEDLSLMDTDPGNVRANAYDMILNGTELGGGSIRIHDRDLQERVFQLLGMEAEEYNEKFGFLMGAFEYGAPPHGGLAFGFDRVCALLGGADAIRDFIAFPKNNSGRDVMINAPSLIDQQQYEELHIASTYEKEETK